MTDSEGWDWGYAEVLLKWYYDEESGGFYISSSDKTSRSYEPNLFSTIEALWALFQSPLQEDQHEKIQQTIQFLCDELKQYDDLCPANPEMDRFAFEHSVISVSYSLIVLTRARKYSQRHSLKSKYRSRLDECIRKHLQFVCEAQKDDDGGWGIVPQSFLPRDGPDFDTEVYCTAIALMAIQSCTFNDFESAGYDKSQTEQIVANGFGALVEITEIPDPVPKEANPDTISEDVLGDATIISTWMLSLTRIFWDRGLWSDYWDDPTQFTEFDEILRKGSLFLRSIVSHDEQHDDIELVDFQYGHEIIYPYRSSDGSIRTESFLFELPSNTIASALALSPVVSVWSNECQYIKNEVKNLIATRRQSVVINNQTTTNIYQIAGPIVNITYVNAAEQGITKVMRHFIQWGEVPDIDPPAFPNGNQITHSANNQGFFAQLGYAGDRFIQNLQIRLRKVFNYFLDSPESQTGLFAVILFCVYLGGRVLGWSSQTISRSLVLFSIPAISSIVYSFSYKNGLSKVQAGITSLIPPLVLAGIASLFLVESRTAIVGGTLIVEIISASIVVLRMIDENESTV